MADPSALAAGVFPLKPVSRVWTLNEMSGAKVTRKGFTLVPDIASSGFMIQGTTLHAEMAECGDIFAIPGFIEMVTTYVILSRVRKADGLLLMRAFSPYLFRLGSPPGPHCLTKLLRHRLTGTAQGENVTYTPGDATAEYTALAQRWEDEKMAEG